MIVKLVIFLCSVYVVNAYVAINIFDDEVATRNSSVGIDKGLSDCIPRGCWTVCRGDCVNGFYKCNQFLEMGDADSQVTPRMDLDESPVISECSPLGCAQLCRRLVSDKDDTQISMARCDWANCNRGCRSIGYSGGRCVGSQCRCNARSVKHHVENVDDIEETQESLTRCDSSSCYRGCRSIGNRGGHCVGNECRCDPRSERNHLENVDNATETNLEKCHSSSCNLKCRSFGFVRGFCIAKRCICLPRSAKAEDSNLIISSDGEVQEMKLENPAPMLSDCNIRACEQLCRRIFLKGGSCVNGQCKCDIISDTTESNEIPLTKNEDKYEETALDDDQESLVGRCFTSQCIQMCQRIGFISGKCDYRDACTCY